MLSILLVICAAGLGFKAYTVWHEGPWELPQPVKPRALVAAPAQKAEVPPGQRLAGTEFIVSKNLFDPERGAVKSQESEVEVRSVQRVRNLILLGTAIIGNNRFAIIQEPDNQFAPGMPNPQTRVQPVRRLKVGDSIEGFSVSEIADKRVILTRGATRVEVSVDYFRKVAPAPGNFPGAPQVNNPNAIGVPVQPGAPSPVPPNVIPNLPRRPRLPTPPSP